MLTAYKNEEGNQYLCAYFVGKEMVESIELRAYIGDELPDYMIPSYFIQLEEMPLSTNGKIDRKALPEIEDVYVGGEYVEPRNNIEKKLSVIWSEALGVNKIGIYDNFFELGGHSLIATSLI